MVKKEKEELVFYSLLYLMVRHNETVCHLLILPINTRKLIITPYLLTIQK